MPDRQIFAHVPAVMLPGFLPALGSLPVGVELLIDHAALDPAFRPELERLAGELRRLRRPVKFHAPFSDLHPAGLDPEAVGLARRRVTAALDLAPLFGVSAVVAHTAWDPDAHGLEREAWIRRAVPFWTEIGRLAEERGVGLALENVFDRDPELLALLLDRLPAAPFGINLDLGHWHAYSHADLDAWVGRLGEKILSLHLHDNHGLADEHMALGAGSIPWRECFSRLRGLPLARMWTLENRSEADVRRSLAFLARESGISEFTGFAALPANGALGAG